MSQTQETKRYSITLSRTTETTEFKQTREYSTYESSADDYRKLVTDAAAFHSLIGGTTEITLFYLPYGSDTTRVLKSFNLSSTANI